MQLFAQYNKPQNKVWAFALNKGLNFSPGPAPVSMATSIYTQEGSAAVSDNSGNLLFYTGGINGTTGAKVYDRTGAVMPNGSSIVPFATYSCTQAAAIVPVIGNPNRYYVFSLEQGGSGAWGSTSASFCRLYSCIVDMTLNGGLGDVIASTIATPLDSGLCEKMTVVGGDNCDIWLLTHKKDLPHFKAYNISSTGISAPVVSTATGEIPTGLNAYKIGTIKVSPNRTMISNVVLNGAYGGVTDRLELLQFNPATGIVTGCQVLNTFTNQYDAEFSPDNSKLYSRVLGSGVYQYDLSLLPSIAAVISSQFLVYASPDWGGQMKLGPNGKIYLQTGAGYVDCINSPNLAGSLCNFTYHAVNVGAASTQNLGMPNMQIVAELADTIHTITDSTKCALTGITLNAPSGSSWYTWSNGATTPSVTVTGAGIYWVKSSNGCDLHIDSFNVINTPLTVISSVAPTSFCTGLSATLTAPTSYTAPVWNTGATTSSITVTAGGTYWVADTSLSACNLQIDTFQVAATPLAPMPTITTDSFCAGSSATLTAPPGYISHVWSTGATTSSIVITTAGTYWVADTVFSTCTLYTNTFDVTAIPLPVVALGNDKPICLGDSMTLSSPLSAGSFLWSTGSTASSITVRTGGIYYLTITKQGCSNSDTIKISQLSAPSPIVLGSDTILCKGEVFLLRSDADAPLWSTGVTANSISITDSGTYSATVTNDCGTSISYIHVALEPCNLDFPDAFTPNKDGLNDLAKVLGNLGAFTDFRLSIYNRYGQRVFYTEDIYAGWDGRFNEVPQDLGVYFYMITYTLKGKHGMLKGDLTLVR